MMINGIFSNETFRELLNVYILKQVKTTVALDKAKQYMCCYFCGKRITILVIKGPLNADILENSVKLGIIIYNEFDNILKTKSNFLAILLSSLIARRWVGLQTL